MLRLDELRIFVAAACAGSFVGAAEQLRVAPSVISKTVKSLENKLNTTLFSRTTRKILITSDGEWLLERALKTMAGLEAIRDHFADSDREPEGRLTVDAATPFVLHAIAPVIAAFTDRFPKIGISLESSEAVADLIERRVDVAIRIGELKDSTLKAIRLGSTRRALYASPGYIARYGEPKAVDDLVQHRCLGFNRPRSLNTWPLADDSGAPVVVTPCLEANSGETLKQLAVFGNGIACVSAFTVQRELQRGELLPVMAALVEPHAIPIYAVHYSERAAARHIRLFLDFLQENIRFAD